MNVKKLSIIIPVYNESLTIHLILNKIKTVKLLNDITKELIIVNDCSTDKTKDTIEEYIRNNSDIDIRYAEHKINKGKGAALHTGITKATGELIIIQDADLEYDPNEYNNLLKPVLDGFADVVYGSRFMGDNPHRILFFWHTLGNRFLTFLSNMFNNLNLTDMETCYKLFRRELIAGLELESNRFNIEPEMTAKVLKMGAEIYEVPVSYKARKHSEGKKIGWPDFGSAVWTLIRYRL